MRTAIRLFYSSALIVTLGLTRPATASAAELPIVDDLVDILEKNAPQFTVEELDQAAINGIIAHSDGTLRLVDPSMKVDDLLNGSSVYEEKYLQIRVRNFDQNLENAISQEIKSHQEAGSITGLILDLRYADGPAYEEVVPVANLFSDSGKPVFELDGEMRSIHSSDRSFALPVIILTNSDTRHAAEALAAAIRLADAGVIVGSNTAGMAFSYNEYELADGRKLQIAGERLKLGDGTTIDESGVAPDIRVDIDPEDEAQWYEDPFLRLSQNTTLATRLNEAALVRQHDAVLNGTTPADEFFNQSENAAPEVRTIQDPALARGIDLLKGLVLLKHLRQP